MIIGAGEACKTILGEMMGTDCPYYPVCIVDDSKEKNLPQPERRARIRSHQPDPRAVRPAAYRYDPAGGSLHRRGIPQTHPADLLLHRPTRIKTLPYLHTMIEDDALLSQVKEVRVEDLLGRDPIQFDNREIASFIEGGCVW